MIKAIVQRVVAAAVVLVAGVAKAQCDVWIPTAGDSELRDVRLMAAMDHDGDGPGAPRLYAVTSTSFHGTTAALRYWDGRAWNTANGVGGTINAMMALNEAVPGIPAGCVILGGTFAGGASSARVIGAYDGTTLFAIGPSASTDVSTGANVRALTTWDPDGDGPLPPRLVAGGTFTRLGGVNATNIAMWDGTAWRALGVGVAEPVNALTSFDPDGSGPAAPLLMVATGTGSTNSFVRAWNGTAWQQLGAFNGRVNALAVFDADGAGPVQPVLYAGGFFSTVGGVSMSGVVRWTDEMGWSTAGSGGLTSVSVLRVLDIDGGGPLPQRLIAGGSGSDSTTVAILYDNAWVLELDGPRGGGTQAIEAFDPDADGPRSTALIAAGSTTYFALLVSPTGTTRAQIPFAGPNARGDEWWGPLGPEIAGGRVYSFHNLTGAGSESGLYASGSFTFAGGRMANGLAKWDGQRWVGQGIPNVIISVPTHMGALSSFDFDGSGPQPPRLIASRRTASISVNVGQAIMQWVNNQWVPLGVRSGTNLATSGSVMTFAAFDQDGPGPLPPRLVAGGNIDLRGVVMLNGNIWIPLGMQLSNIMPSDYCLLFIHDSDGSGPNSPSLYAASLSLGTYRWNGTEWIRSFRMYVDPGASFFHAMSMDFDGDGSAPPEIVFGARYVGASSLAVDANWTAASHNGEGFRQLGPPTSTSNDVRGMGSFDPDGLGPVGPQLMLSYSREGMDGSVLQRLTGDTWTSVGSSFTNLVNSEPARNVAAAFITHDPDGDGPLPPELFIGGEFTHADGRPARNFARWRFATLPPAITTHPQSVATCAGGSATLSVAAAGEGNLGFSWRIYDASISTRWRILADGPLVIGGQTVGEVSGAATGSLIVTPVPEVNFGSPKFQCVVTNACGAATSGAATVTVRPCGTADFNGDGDVGTDADIEAFFACLAGDCCTACGPIDFNADCSAGDDADIEAFFRVLAGGSC